MHCNYPIPEEYGSKHKLFLGFHSVASSKAAIKSFIKLKKILKGCEWFDLSKLEKQKMEGKSRWELGQFLDIEAEKIQRLCGEENIEIEFVEIVGVKNA